MPSQRPTGSTLLSTAPWLAELIDRFERAWQTGEPPELGRFLPAGPNGRREALLALVPIDLEYRWRSVDHQDSVSRSFDDTDRRRRIDVISPRPLLEDYQRAFPELGPVAELPAEFVVWEYRMRCCWGDMPANDEYRRRFPMHGAELDSAISNVDRELASERAHERPSADGDAERGVRSTSSALTRLHVLREHKKGGLGQVSVAIDEEFQREVALKEIQEQYADHPESRARFLLEAQVTGKLEHPGIVPVYCLGTYDDGRPYYAMRFIKGESFKEAIDRFHGNTPTRGAECGADDDAGPREHEAGLATQPGSSRQAGRAKLRTKVAKAHGPTHTDFISLEFRKLLGRLLDVCNAMEYAHSRGVLHRDLKPANIMLGKYGETLVVDWGLAKVVGRRENPQPDAVDDEGTLLPVSTSSAAPTQLGHALGTPQYMSPEQAEGRWNAMGPTSDVYSLGATLYCLLAGRSPYSGVAANEVVERVAIGEFPPPRQVNRKVPRALEAICLKAMAFKASDRYATARALGDEVERWLGDEPVKAVPESLLHRFARWRRRHRPIVAAVCVSALFLIAWGATRYRDSQSAAQFASLALALDMSHSSSTATPEEEWERHESIVRDMKRIDSDQSAAKESEFLTFFARRLEREMSETPRLLMEDVLRYKGFGTLLKDRVDDLETQIPAVEDFRNKLLQRLGKATPLFPENAVVRREIYEVAPDSTGLVPNVTGPIFATRQKSHGAVEFEISIPAGALTNREVALALDFIPEKGTLDCCHVTFFGDEEKRKCRVRIMNGAEILRERYVYLPNEPLTLSIKRVREHLEAKLNDRLSLEFDSTFPLGDAQESGVFAVRCPDNAQIVGLRAWRTTFDESPLEKGDSRFARGKYGEALDQYALQAALTKDNRDVLQELRYKQARCHLELDNPTDAEALLLDLTAEEGGAWPALAACELFVVRAKRSDWQGADAAFARLAHVPEGSETLAVVFDSVRARVLPMFLTYAGLGVARQARLRREDVYEFGKLVEMALNGANIPESVRSDTMLKLARAYVASDIDRVEPLFQSLLARADLALEQGDFRFLVDSYTNLLVGAGRPSAALEVIAKLRERTSLPDWLRACLALQRARALAAMKKDDDSRSALDEFFTLAADEDDRLAPERIDGWILRGFLAPDDGVAIEIWNEGYHRLKHSQRMGYIGLAILASLSQELTADDAKTLIANVAGANAGLFPFATTVSFDALFIPEIHPALRDMWHWPRGRSYVRDLAFHKISYRTIQLVQVPLCVAEVTRKGAFDEPLPADVEQFIWSSMDQLWREFQAGRISLFPDVAQLFATWKGIRAGPLGWLGVSEKLRKDLPRQHADLAFIMGCHFRKMNNPHDALLMLQEAKTAAAALSQDDENLRRLIDGEIKKMTRPEKIRSLP